MTPDQFIAKWQANTRPERAAYVEHFNDLCALLGEATPNEADPEGNLYAFEKGATKTTGARGWADVWKRHHFAIEYKGKGKDLGAAFRQLQGYALALDNPPLLVVCDLESWVIRTNWTNTVSATHTLLLEDLRRPEARQMLKAMLAEPERLRPGITREKLTEEAARQFAELAQRLRARGHEPQAVAHFINRLVFCLFADDVGLLPPGLFDKMLAAGRKLPERFQGFCARLFAAMHKPGGEIDFTPVDWFNGGLFDDDTALPLLGPDIALLQRAAALDWAEVDASIFGTLFERGLDPEKRSQLGAHYTDRAKIDLIIGPVILRPLEAEWAAIKPGIAAAMARASEAARTPGRTTGQREAARNRAAGEAAALLGRFLDRLRRFRVLDPACGSGNFLYLALQALKDIEHRVMLEAEALGLPREFPRIGPEVVLGIELNPYAAELARVSVWIGAIQWARRNGMPTPSDPVLKPLDHIQCRDALLEPDGSRAEWPEADAIVGNPPFIGDKAMLRALGEEYVGRLREAYAGRVPASADFVCHWFEKAREAVVEGRSVRAGLVATNSIRGGANRKVLDHIAGTSRIFDAWSDEPWSVDGAAVRVSLVCFGNITPDEVLCLNGAVVAQLHADLTSEAFDLTIADRLPENRDVAFIGCMKKAPFDVPVEDAQRWIEAPWSPAGCANSDVLRPWANGDDVLSRPRGRWIIDFEERTEAEAARYPAPFAHVLTYVQPKRIESGSPQERRYWWRLARRAPAMLAATQTLDRFIVSPRVAKHRLFAWASPPLMPDGQLVVVARDDDTTFGILHSRFHEAWALRLGTFLGVGNDPRYTPTTTFETFPFPQGLTPNIPAATQADHPPAAPIAEAARALVAARDRWLNPPEWVEMVPDLLPHLPPRAMPRNAEAARKLKARTLTALYNTRGLPEGRWLDDLHAALDAAVAAAYGWPADITDEAALAALLALNRERAATQEGAGN